MKTLLLSILCALAVIPTAKAQLYCSESDAKARGYTFTAPDFATLRDMALRFEGGYCAALSVKLRTPTKERPLTLVEVLARVQTLSGTKRDQWELVTDEAWRKVWRTKDGTKHAEADLRTHTLLIEGKDANARRLAGKPTA
jgi:hypothetical protein